MLFIIYTFLLVPSFCFALGPDQDLSKLTQTQNNIKNINQEIKKDSYDRVLNLENLQKFEITIQQTSYNIEKLNILLKQQQKNFILINQQLNNLEKNLEIQKKDLNKYLVLSKKLTNHSPIKLFLNQSEPGKISRSLAYYRILQSHCQNKLADLSIKLNATDANKKSAEKKIAEIKNHQLEKTKNLETLNATYKQRKKFILDLQQDLNKKLEYKNLLVRDEKKLKEILNNRQNGINFLINNNQEKIHWPTENFKSHLAAAVSKNNQNNNNNLNRFIVPITSGKPVYAIRSGQVIFADWLRGYGLLIIIAHNNHFMSLYGHNQTLFFKVGDKIKAGDTISLVGQSGGYLEAGLYFEVRENGQPINLGNLLKNETKS